MKIVLAHSDINYMKKLKIFFLNKGVTDIHAFSNGFNALSHIIKSRSNIVIIEETLPGLNATDIQNALVFKHLKPEIIILKPYRNIPPEKVISKIKSEFSLDKTTF
ncbi:hypothetical protein [uncultured Kordia sp.]|uniref:hypothetical protein n=1 Tax=uncultured Kordia sp. TaxID=507699 RepID=UPI002618A060|nr:hypothetical protein [uncultured Kordia sp.]